MSDLGPLVTWHLGIEVLDREERERSFRKIGAAMLAIASPAGEELSSREIQGKEPDGEGWARAKLEALGAEMRRMGWSVPEIGPELVRGRDYDALEGWGRDGEGWSLDAGWLAFAEAARLDRREGESGEDVTRRAMDDLESAARRLGFLGIAHERWAMSSRKPLEECGDDVENCLVARIDRLAQRRRLEESASAGAKRKRKAAL